MFFHPHVERNYPVCQSCLWASVFCKVLTGMEGKVATPFFLSHFTGCASSSLIHFSVQTPLSIQPCRNLRGHVSVTPVPPCLLQRLTMTHGQGLFQ